VTAVTLGFTVAMVAGCACYLAAATAAWPLGGGSTLGERAEEPGGQEPDEPPARRQTGGHLE
jgi:hypothetical protein